MTKASRDLEILVAKIQQQLAPNAKITHDARLQGFLTEGLRQIDVLVQDRIGQYEMTIVIDAKDHAAPVDIKGVEEFDGLVKDVRAHRGVLVSPKGFTNRAKILAKKLNIDVYSPVDTDPHKWQATVLFPIVVDFRSARISFGISSSAPLPLQLPADFFSNSLVYDKAGKTLGTIWSTAIEKWNGGRFPSEPGEYEGLPIFDVPVTEVDSGAVPDLHVPVELYVGLQVERQLYYGLVPVSKISGFYDHQTGQTITNAFTLNLLDPEEIEKTWKPISKVDEAPMKPVIMVKGLWGWPA